MTKALQARERLDDDRFKELIHEKAAVVMERAVPATDEDFERYRGLMAEALAWAFGPPYFGGYAQQLVDALRSTLARLEAERNPA